MRVMGYDCSYHPVDLKQFQEEILGAATGERPLKALTARAIELEKRRYRAKAWALAAIGVQHEEGAAKKKTKASETTALESDLHVWGRPFFIGASDAEDVSKEIDRWLAAKDDAAVDALARETLKAVAPGLEKKLKPDLGTGLPKGDELASAVLRDFDALPEMFAAVRAGKRSVTLPNGETDDPRSVLASSLLFVAVSLASHFRPGWMSRGYVWPSMMLDEAGLDPAKFFETPAAMLGPLAKEMPFLTQSLEATITENYTTGGYVPARKVGDLRALLAKSEKKLLAKAKKEDWEDHARLSLRKIDEALCDAERRGFPFLEACEVYSGPMGFLN